LVNRAIFGPVHCAWWPYRRGDTAEPRVRAWLATTWNRAPETLMLSRDAHGRPQLDGGGQHADLHQADLNWSHSGDWLIAACAETARVGIDIELLRPRPKALALAQRFFAPEETAWLRTLADDPERLQHAFTRLWCAKEALLKAHGRGLSFGLEKLRFELDDTDATPRLVACDCALGPPADWRLQAWAPAPGYLATLAWRAVAEGSAGGASAPNGIGAEGIGAEAPPTTPATPCTERLPHNSPQ
jgi:4'-phosphopantetheinyl transferase